MTSDNELIERAREGDGDAFCELAGRYERRIFSLAFHYCRDSHDAEDLSQEVWLKAYRGLKAFRGESSFYTWLRQIMINTFLNYKRANAATESLTDTTEAWESVKDLTVRIEEEVGNKMMVEAVIGALGELSAQQRLIFLLKHREGMTYDEISSSLGCSTGTVKKSLFRAVIKLRERLGINAGAGESHARL